MSAALNPNGVDIGQLNQEVSQLQLQQAQLQQLQVPHQPSMFRRILGGVTGIAGNMFAPGLGGALGSFIGGGSSLGGGLGNSALSTLFQTNNTSQFSAQLAAAQAAGNAANLAADEQLLAVAKQGNEDEEQVELASNLEKLRHSTLMSVIQNIGS